MYPILLAKFRCRVATEMELRRIIRSLAEMIQAKDEEVPRFRADLLAEIARVQTERDRAHFATEERIPRDRDTVLTGKEGTEPSSGTENDPRSSSSRRSLCVDRRQRRPRLCPWVADIMGPPSEGCWGCRGPDHFRRECPRRGEYGPGVLLMRPPGYNGAHVSEEPRGMARPRPLRAGTRARGLRTDPDYRPR